MLTTWHILKGDGTPLLLRTAVAAAAALMLLRFNLPGPWRMQCCTGTGAGTGCCAGIAAGIVALTFAPWRECFIVDIAIVSEQHGGEFWMKDVPLLAPRARQTFIIHTCSQRESLVYSRLLT
jgi:hypothetical protein